MSKKLRSAFYLDGENIIAESDVVRFAVGYNQLELISEVWTFFGSKNHSDFYVTSSLISTDQKGSIHPRRAQFGYTSQTDLSELENWVGSPPLSRHMETLEIPPLVANQHFHVMTIRLPGIGLRQIGCPAERPKPIVLIEPYDIETCVTLNLVLYEGDWRDFIAPFPGQKAIAALRNMGGRSLIVFMRKEHQSDAAGYYRRFLDSIPTSKNGDTPESNLTLFATHTRAQDQPIILTELHDIAHTKSARKPHA